MPGGFRGVTFLAPSTQIGLLMVSMVSFSNGTSTSFSIICLSCGMSSRMPTTPNTSPLPLFVEQRQDDPAAVLALVMISHRVQRVLARTPFAELRADQLGLRQHRS